MKTVPVILSLILLSAGAALARLGDTPDQCASRYGFSTGQSGQFTMYSKDHMLIAIAFVEGVSVKEVFLPEPSSKFTDSQISDLLALNAGASRWTVQLGEYYQRLYSREDGAASATLGRKGELTISSNSSKIVSGQKSGSGL